ncbi:hypothetical protein Trydic_g9010 [Trypoxylus dichotomus]
MRSLILVTFCSIWLFVFGLELPSYLRRCSLSDPYLEQCIIDNANIAIPRVVKGEAKYNWPALSPLLLPELELPGPIFNVILRNVRLEGFENFKMTYISYSLDRIPQILTFATPLFTLTADYTIQHTGLFSRSILGGGKLRTALEQNVMQYNWDLTKVEKDGKIYLKYDNGRLSLETGRIRYNFTDLYIPDKRNIEEFIGIHKEIINYRIRPAVERVTLTYLQSILDNFIAGVPIKDIFDP